MLTVDVAAKAPFGNEILQKGLEKGVVEGEQESIRLFLESRPSADSAEALRGCDRRAGTPRSAGRVADPCKTGER